MLPVSSIAKPFDPTRATDERGLWRLAFPARLKQSIQYITSDEEVKTIGKNRAGSGSQTAL